MATYFVGQSNYGGEVNFIDTRKSPNYSSRHGRLNEVR
jgi:hypothetical protein